MVSPRRAMRLPASLYPGEDDRTDTDSPLTVDR
jgi:hypothetical protein